MTYLITLAVGVAIGYFWGKSAVMGQTDEEQRRMKVLGLFDAKTEISNEDVESALGVSDATATRILDELEKSGQIAQIGQVGAGVRYKRIVK